jgi:aminoglycoside phosphotransferase (APT) family kinase protein
VPNDVLPEDPTSIDAAWMQHALASGGVVGTLTNVEFAGYIGTGQMGRNARYKLTWDNSENKPATIVGKFPTDDPTGRASGFSSSYRKEFTFYTELASTVDVRAPKCYVARFDEPGQNFVLLMEDLAGSVQGDQMRGLNESEAELAVEQAVALHAPRWGDPQLLQLTFGEVFRTREETRERLQMIYDACCEPTLARLSANLPADAINLVREFAPYAGAWATASDAPVTMLHMDFRPDNFLFGVHPDAPALAIVDWQTITAGPGTHDLAYMIGGSFEPEVRARVERGLVQSYCQRLEAQNIQYTYDACWRDYRISSLWGVIMSVIATMLASQTERGDLMLTTMLRRHAAHAIELDALSLVRGTR